MGPLRGVTKISVKVAFIGSNGRVAWGNSALWGQVAPYPFPTVYRK